MLKSHLFSASVNSRNNSVGEKFTENNMEYIQKGNIMHQEYLYWRLSESESINLCKQQVDTMERWSRRLIDETFSAIFGKDYLTVKNPETNESLFKTDLLNKINARCKNDSACKTRHLGMSEHGQSARCAVGLSRGVAPLVILRQQDACTPSL